MQLLFCGESGQGCSAREIFLDCNSGNLPTPDLECLWDSRLFCPSPIYPIFRSFVVSSLLWNFFHNTCTCLVFSGTDSKADACSCVTWCLLHAEYIRLLTRWLLACKASQRRSEFHFPFLSRPGDTEKHCLCVRTSFSVSAVWKLCSWAQLSRCCLRIQCLTWLKPGVGNWSVINAGVHTHVLFLGSHNMTP